MLAPTEAAARAKLDHYYPAGINEECASAAWLALRLRSRTYYQSLVDAGMEYFVVARRRCDIERFERLAREVIPAISTCLCACILLHVRCGFMRYPRTDERNNGVERGPGPETEWANPWCYHLDRRGNPRKAEPRIG